MKQTFKINAEEYQHKNFTAQEVACKILPSMYGTTIRHITYEKLAVVVEMLNNGWRLLPGFYGEKTESGTLLKPNISWFMKWCGNVDRDVVFQYAACINYHTNEVNLYDSERLIGTFPTIQDMHSIIERLSDTLPLACDSYSDTNLVENVSYFDRTGKFDDICGKDDKVYPGMENYGLGFFVDYDSLVKIGE